MCFCARSRRVSGHGIGTIVCKLTLCVVSRVGVFDAAVCVPVRTCVRAFVYNHASAVASFARECALEEGRNEVVRARALYIFGRQLLVAAIWFIRVKFLVLVFVFRPGSL